MKLNNKGFAITGILYSVLILFLALLLGILGIISSRKILLDKTKSEIINKLNDVNIGEIALPGVDVKITPEGWSLSKNIEITYPKGYLVKYSLDEKETWNNYTEPFSVTKTGDLVVSISDGKNEDEAVYKIEDIDTTIPESSLIKSATSTNNSITVSVEASDNQSGIYGYQYSIDGGNSWMPSTPTEATTYTFENLEGTLPFEVVVRSYNNTFIKDGIKDNYLDSEIKEVLLQTIVVGQNFSTDSWETIIEAVKNGDASAYKVGDTKTIDMGTLGTHTVRISNTTACDGSLQSETACGFVIEFADIITNHAMNDTNTNEGGWPATKMRTYLNNDIYNALPEDLKNGIINTKVISGYGKYGSSNFETTDKLYLLSTAEVWPSGQVYDTATDSTITRQLYYYTLSTSTRIKQNDGSNAAWLLRSAYHYDYSPNFYAVDSRGSYEYIVPTDTSGVSPAFRLEQKK